MLLFECMQLKGEIEGDNGHMEGAKWATSASIDFNGHT